MSKALNKSSRYLAVESLEKIEKDQAYSNIEINRIIEANELSREDARLLTQLVYGVTQHRLTLDFYLGAYLKKGKKVDSWVRQLLRLSIYQALYLDRIPDHAIVDEAVKIAKKRGHKGTGGFVNAVLRNFQRDHQKDQLRKFEELKDPLDYLEVKYSLPKVILEELIEDIGREETEKVAAAFLEEPHASVRVNERYISRQEALEELENEGFEVEKSQVSSVGIRAEKGQFSRSKLFQKGWITIQDETSMLVAEALDVKAHHQVLDACAAPGGKTTHIANYLSDQEGGHVLAADIHDHKLKLIEENAERQGFSPLVTPIKMDAKEAADKLDHEIFDRVLVDAPCSGIGLLRRKPDIKYNKTKEDFIRLQKIQLEILNGVAPLVKTGGILVYSTCTIIKKENEETIQKFLERHPEFRMTQIKLKESVIQAKPAGYIKIYPHERGTDGFFISALEKINK